MQARWLLLTILCVALLAVGQMLFNKMADTARPATTTAAICKAL